MPSARPRRLFFVLLSLPVLFLLFLYLSSRSGLFSATAEPSNLPNELFGLLHFVTSPDEAGRVIHAVGDSNHNAHGGAGSGNVALERENEGIAPDQPVPIAWYALGSIAKTSIFRMRGKGSSAHDDEGWEERLRTLREQYPLVVFSKTYCPYSKRAKRLLETYDLSPPPKVIEVDLRADAPHIKTVLARLTHQSTFPNVILQGRSLGGSDDLVRLHEGGQLRQVLEKGGVKVGWKGEGSEGGLL